LSFAAMPLLLYQPPKGSLYYLLCPFSHLWIVTANKKAIALQ